MEHRELKLEMIAVALELYHKNCLAAADGNISVKLADDEILITPSGRPKRSITPEDMALIDVHNRVISGHPSSEMQMHTYIYRHCPEAKVVVHAHPPTAIAWTIAQPQLQMLPAECLSELIIATGGIPIAPYALPGTEQMGEVLAPFLPQYRAIILARHGALSWGESLEEALNGIERIEHTAQILKAAKELGQLTYLEEDAVEKLYQLRRKIGNRLL